jgi:two-component system, cell cycle sensor histidine kinase and response regulator CckA
MAGANGSGELNTERRQMPVRVSIRTRIVVVMSAVVAAIALFLVTYYPAKLAQREKEFLVAKAQSIAAMTAYTVGPAVVFEDKAMAQEAIRSARQNRDVSYIVITNDSDRVFTGFNTDEATRLHFTDTDTPESLSSDSTVFRTSVPIMHSREIVGTLYLGLSLSELQAERTASRTSFGLHSISIFVIGLLVIAILTTLITQPLKAVVRTAETIAAGDLGQRAAALSNDEIGDLARAFNKMVDHLISAQETLEEVNRDLEIRVQSRTSQMQDELKQRRDAEEELYRSRQLMQLVLDNIPQRIFWKDRHCRFLGCNHSFLEDAGLKDISEIIGKTDYEMSWKKSADHFRADDIRVMESDTPKINFEEPQEHTDGHTLWLRTSKIPLHDRTGAVIGILGTYQDITEQRRVEENLRQQAAIQDITRDAVIVVGLDDRIQLWNKAAESLYGYSAEEVRGRRPQDLIYQEGDEILREEAKRQVLDSGEWTGDLRHKTQSGEIVLVDSRWTLVKDGSGEPKSILVVNTDITRRREMESQVHRSQRLEIVGTLAGGVAHDLNNVLSPILMAIQLLKDKVSDIRGREWLNTIEASAQRGADIIRQILTFARGAEGERALIQPKHLLREISTIAGETFPRAIQVKTQVAKDLWTISGDATQLHQVLMNLSVNARDAMPSGGILNLKAVNVVLDETTARINIDAHPGSYVAISVTDTGTGIPPSIIDKIFDPFFTTKEVGKGTGLGLSTVLTIVKSHGGFIHVDSTLNAGTTFTIYLPSSTSASAGTTLERTGEPRMGNGEWVLIVDDEQSVREITRGALESWGYKVILASNGMEAIDIIKSQGDKISVVLTDMMMPIMDGSAVIRSVYQLHPEIRIIAASGLADIEKLSELKGTPIHAFLPKPFTSEKLLITIQSILQEGSG